MIASLGVIVADFVVFECVVLVCSYGLFLFAGWICVPLFFGFGGTINFSVC